MICPNCKSNLEGSLIYDTMLEQCGGDEAKALEWAASYGATKTDGKWGREIGIYSIEQDRTVAWKCPDCGHEWGRE